MTHGSLFSGVGGFDLASQWMGWENAFHCEINPFGRQVLEYYWPNSVSYEDITKTDFTVWRNRIDILTGGFPCQPFSLAGKRKGKEDDRYLWPEMLRAIDEIRPRWVCGENVAGIVSMVQPEAHRSSLESTADFFGEEDSQVITEYQEYVIETVCNDLERIGYSVQPVIIPACAVGAPHRRDRIWFIANAHDRRSQVRRPESSNGLPESREAWNFYSDNISKTKKRGCFGDFAYPSITGLEVTGQTGFRKYETEAGEGLDGGLEQLSGNAADSNSQQRRKGRMHATESETAKRHTGSCCAWEGWGNWQNFPTQPPVCGGNDGISTQLDGITFSKWRNESIRAYGNAIVPQVVFEIFKAIAKSENEQNKTK